MKIVDWFILKSSEFKSLFDEYKKHKNNTKNSFKKVKRDNILIVQKLRQHERKISSLNKQLNKINKIDPIKFYKKR